MKRDRRVRIAAVVAVTTVLAAASAWTTAATAAQRLSVLKIVTGTVSCATSQGSLQINAIAYRPSLGYAAASITTGFPNTPATIHLVGVQTDKSDYTRDRSCSRTKTSVRFTHRGLSSSGVVKAGYNQSPTVYCGAPRRVIVRYRIGFASSGKPASATMTVWAKRKHSSRLRETGYLQWSRGRSITYYSKRACTSQY